MTAVADLGNLRLELGTRLGLRTPGVLAYAWVHRFPLFTWDEEGKRWDATHNPFSAPSPRLAMWPLRRIRLLANALPLAFLQLHSRRLTGAAS